jgi:hypothetical protein
VMQCPTCMTKLKPLFTGWYCPNDCDRNVTDYEDGSEFYYVGRVGEVNIGEIAFASTKESRLVCYDSLKQLKDNHLARWYSKYVYRVKAWNVVRRNSYCAAKKIEFVELVETNP